MPTPITSDRRALRATLLVAALALASGAAAIAGTPADAFAAENAAAMDKMMAAMDIHPSGDVDRDFVAMMIPHHQGAIDMAQAELRYGHDETLRRIAQEIVVDQQQEIAAMDLAVGAPLPPSGAAPTQAGPASDPATSAPAAPAAHLHHHE